MKSSTCTALTAAACLFLSPFPLLGNSPSWSQTYNPTLSDPLTGNTAGGSESLAANTNTTNELNTAFGDSTLGFVTSGWGNSGFGVGALAANTTAIGNTAVGAFSLFRNSSGPNNTAVGYDSLAFTTTGAGNTAIGYSALGKSTSGFRNTGLGAYVMQSATTAQNNIAIGWSAGSALTTGTFNVYIAHAGQPTENRVIRVGTQGTHTNGTFVAGIHGKVIKGSTVTINSAGQLGTLPSSARYKEDIADMRGQSAHIMQLRPVTYHYKNDDTKTKQYGLIAEEVAKVYPELVVYGENGIESIQYQGLIPMLLNEVQEQKKAIAVLQERLTVLEGKQ